MLFRTPFGFNHAIIQHLSNFSGSFTTGVALEIRRFGKCYGAGHITCDVILPIVAQQQPSIV
tara:strand:+ start:340 stop:525 length:186 start_codon:yes stop_codon:yes gene_type:complete